MGIGTITSSSSALSVSEFKFKATISDLADKISTVTQGIAKIKTMLDSPESSAAEKRSAMIEANQLYAQTTKHRSAINDGECIIASSSYGQKSVYTHALESSIKRINANHIDLINLRETYEASMPTDTRRFELITCVNRSEVSLKFASDTKTWDGERA